MEVAIQLYLRKGFQRLIIPLSAALEATPAMQVSEPLVLGPRLNESGEILISLPLKYMETGVLKLQGTVIDKSKGCKKSGLKRY